LLNEPKFYEVPGFIEQLAKEIRKSVDAAVSRVKAKLEAPIVFRQTPLETLLARAQERRYGDLISRVAESTPWERGKRSDYGKIG